MKIILCRLISLVLLVCPMSTYAERIPDESSACYKKCLQVRSFCRSDCMNKHAKDSNEKKYACLDSCDPPFNHQCITKCPTKEND